MEFTTVLGQLKSTSIFLLPGFLLLTTITDVKALSCYVCDSMSSASCKTHPHVVGIQDCSKWCNERSGYIPQVSITDSRSYRTYPPTPCPEKFTSCRKIWQSATQSSENGGYAVERTIRACGFVGNETQPQYTKRNAESTRMMVHTCFGDGCNAGSGLHRGPGSAIFISLLCWTLITVGYHWLL